MTQAAKKLFISQQTLSSAIQRLEKEYHTQFFLRGPHLQLTDAGHCMVTYAREMLALENKLTDTLDEVAQNLRGHITLGITPIRSRLILPDFLPQFYQKYPHIDLTLLVDGYRQLEEQLQDDTLDVLVATSRTAASHIERQLLYRDPFCLLLPQKLLTGYFPQLAGKKPAVLSVEQLDPGRLMDLLVQEPFLQMIHSAIKNNGDSFFYQLGINPRPLYSIHDLETVTKLTLRGLGYSFSFAQFAAQMNREYQALQKEQPPITLVQIPHFDSEICCLTKKHKTQSYALKILLKELTEYFQGAESGETPKRK